MRMQSRNEQGAILVLTALLSVILIGVAALALDMGRLFVLHSEMHNAADAAALSAAAELDGQSGAQIRARTAARELLSHQGHFASNPELLEDLPDSAFTFYCAIGSEYDIESDAANTVCTTSEDPDEPYHYPASNDSDSHYVRVTLESDGDYYLIDLFFRPVLGLLTGDRSNTAAGHAVATAGRQDMICNYPPLMLCDPYEGIEGGLKGNLEEGAQLQLKVQGPNSSWAAGNFGFLQPNAGPGASNLAAAMADEAIQGCTPRIVSTQPGEVTQPVTKGFNTRFDIYDGYDPDDYPPAPNVVDYPDDRGTVSLANCDDDVDSYCRIGDGDWDIEGYWNQFHTTPLSTFESNTGINRDDAKRFDVYKWEIEHELPCWQYPTPYDFKKSNGDVIGSLDCSEDDPSTTIPGSGANKAKMGIYKRGVSPPLIPGSVDAVNFPSVPASDMSIVDLVDHGPVVDGIPSEKEDDLINRRVLFVATLSCEELGVQGNSDDVPVLNPDGFAKIFLIRHSLGPPFADIDGEYIGWSNNTEADYYVKIQLYE